MTTVWCQLLLPVSLILFYFAKVHAGYAVGIALLPPPPPPPPPLSAAQDAIFLLNKLFSLATHSSHNCSSELLRALEACTQHTHR